MASSTMLTSYFPTVLHLYVPALSSIVFLVFMAAGICVWASWLTSALAAAPAGLGACLLT